MNIIFFGSYPWSVLFLKKLLEFNSIHVVSVVTKYNTRKTSYNKITPVAQFCRDNGICNILCSYDQAIEICKKEKIYAVLSVAYPYIIKEDILGKTIFGGINIHPSLLPRWRGPDPVRRAILHRDGEIGCSIHQLTAKFDEGDILWRQSIPYAGQTCGEVLDLLYKKCSEHIEDVLVGYFTGKLKAVPQLGNSSYARTLGDDEIQITSDTTREQAQTIYNALAPFAYPIFKEPSGRHLSVKSLSLQQRDHPFLARRLSDGTIWILPDNLTL